ncbi:MAG: hypothetical protein R2932_57730 [Caldilineaceae bacterium]
MSSTSSGSVGGISFADDDILSYNMTTGQWAMYLDGSDVGLSGLDIDAFEFLGNDLLLSFNSDSTVPGLGTVDESDVVRFVPTSLGTTTLGSFEWYFDGSDVELTTSGEDPMRWHCWTMARC